MLHDSVIEAQQPSYPEPDSGNHKKRHFHTTHCAPKLPENHGYGTGSSFSESLCCSGRGRQPEKML